MEYLVAMTTRAPAGTPAALVAQVRAREAAHTRELAARGSRPYLTSTTSRKQVTS